MLLTDDVDEIAFMHLMEFDGHQLQAITKGDLDLGELIETTEDEQGDDTVHDAFIERVKTSLGDTVKDVRITHRLTDSPACLVADEHEMSAHLERLLRSSGQTVPGQTPIMELNPDHAIVKALALQPNGTSFDDWTHILFDQALLSEGGQLKDPSAFVRRLNRMLTALFEAPAKVAKKKATRKKKPAAKAAADDAKDAS